jgi:hypothetical protein
MSHQLVKAFWSERPETKNQDGYHGGHLVFAAGLVFERNLPLKSNQPTKYRVNRWRHSQDNVRKRNVSVDPWRPSCFCSGVGFRKEPSSHKVQSTYKMSRQSVKAFSR